MAKTNILVVDDNSSDAGTVADVLEKAGYAATISDNGKDALDEIRKKKYRLILLDILMPRLSGYELLKILREKLNHHVKMAYISIVPESDVDKREVDGFVQKPFDPKDLIAKVKKILKENPTVRHKKVK